jgi:hypothetical protein
MSGAVPTIKRKARGDVAAACRASEEFAECPLIAEDVRGDWKFSSIGRDVPCERRAEHLGRWGLLRAALATINKALGIGSVHTAQAGEDVRTSPEGVARHTAIVIDSVRLVGGQGT